MTFSIVARCADTGMFGVAISSSSPAVAARCAFAEAGVGAATSQNITNPALGTSLLQHLTSGHSAEQAMTSVRTEDINIAYRQLLCVDRDGNAAATSGGHILGTWSEATTQNAAAAGNLLANETVPAAMLTAFEDTATRPNHLGDRLLGALTAGLAAGGEAGPVHSAGLLIVHDVPWPIVDLRIDWSDACPINALSSLWDRYKPQMNDYVTRAINPAAAPSYGVPGDT